VLGLEVALTELFHHPTLDSFAQRASAAARVEMTPIPHANRAHFRKPRNRLPHEETE
jgi:hypothetical protein